MRKHQLFCRVLFLLSVFITEIRSFYIDNNLNNEEESNYGPLGIPHVAYDYQENYHSDEKMEQTVEKQPIDPYFKYEVISTKLMNTKFSNQITSLENSEASETSDDQIERLAQIEKSEEIVPFENLVNSMTDLGVSVIEDIINDTNDFVSIISEKVENSYVLTTEHYEEAVDYDLGENPFVDYDLEDYFQDTIHKSFEVIDDNLSFSSVDDDVKGTVDDDIKGFHGAAKSFEVIEENLSIIPISDEFKGLINQDAPISNENEEFIKESYEAAENNESDTTTMDTPQLTTAAHEELIRIKKENGNEADYYNDDPYYYYYDELNEENKLPFSKDIEENFSKIPNLNKETPNSLLSELDEEKAKCHCNTKQEHENMVKEQIADRIQDKRAIIGTPKKNYILPKKRPIQYIQRSSPKPLFPIFKPPQNSAERVEKIHDNIQRIMRFVNIFSQIDNFIQDKTKKSIKRLARMYEKDEDRQNDF